jgi:hypothetical protein
VGIEWRDERSVARVERAPGKVGTERGKGDRGSERE